MSREIKFRAWIEAILPEETGLYYPTVMQLTADGSVDKFWTNDYKFTADTSKFTLMQYTGLKDKNGVEIYESDILKGFSYEDEPYEVELFPDGSFEYSVAEWGHSGDDFEVIGNIYENPELLHNA